MNSKSIFGESNESTPLLESIRLSDGSKQFVESDKTDLGDDIRIKNPLEKQKYLTNVQIMMHLLKASIGLGVLGLPKALKNSGIVVGPLLLMIIAIATVHCSLLLVDCCRRVCVESGKSMLDYGELADECVKRVWPEYEKYGSTIVNILLCVTQFGVCAGYVLFIAENLHDSMEEMDAVHMKKKVYIPIILPFLLVFCLVKDLGSLYWMSWFANFLMLFVLVSIFQYLYRHLQDPSELDKFSSWGDLPLAFGTATYAFQAISVILPLESRTKNPSHFPWIVNISMGIVTVLYLNMAIFGYMTFKEECKGSITLNLPPNDYYSTVKLLVAVAIFCTYYIQIYVFFQITEPLIFSRVPEKYRFLSMVVLRPITVGITCGLAAAFPHLSDIVSLSGSIGGSSLAFVLPTVFHWIVFARETGRLAMIKNILIIILAVVGSISGTYASLRNIIKDC